MNPTSIYEDMGLILSLAQWVRDLGVSVSCGVGLVFYTREYSGLLRLQVFCSLSYFRLWQLLTSTHPLYEGVPCNALSSV